MTDSTNKKEEDQDQTSNLLDDRTSWDNWPAARQLPENPNIKLVLHGLLLIARKSNGSCEIGIHNNNSDHDLSITVYEGRWSKENMTGRKIHEFKAGNPGNVKNAKFELKVTPPDSHPPGVFFYQRAEDFDRDARTDAANDFRWILDVENHEFYDRALGKLSEKTKPRFVINNGIFYTHTQTLSQFKRFAPGDDLHLGHIALAVGANIYVDDGTEPELIINDVRVPLAARTNYQIEILNDCERNNCDYLHSDPRPRKRNDFHQYHKTFMKGLGEPEFELKCDPPSECRNVTRGKIDLETFGQIDANDAAPCGPIGHGKSDGLS